MPRYRAIPSQVTDLRQAAGNDVSVEPASETTSDEPQLTDPDVAPEASPAEEKKKASPKKTAKS